MEIKVGDIVKDIVTGRPVIVVASQVPWGEEWSNEPEATWDFETMDDNGETCYVDQDELEQINYEDR